MSSAAGGQADQARIDNLYNLLRGPSPSDAAGLRLPPTMTTILQVVLDSAEPMAASSVASTVGVSRPTAQRYLTDLQRRGLVMLELEYGNTGRPVHRYRAAPR